jgi:hypothetical protein
MAVGGVGLLGIGLLGASSWVAVHHGLAETAPVSVDDLPPYGDELRSIPRYGDSPSERIEPYQGPGWYARRSGNGRFVAVTESWRAGVVGELLLGFFIERPFIHTVGVWDEQTHQLTRVLSIEEADPHSGIAHRYAWSSDSQALLIYGAGRLPDDYNRIRILCIVYLPKRKELYCLRNCPEL